MRKVSEYEKHAAECLKMASQTKDPVHKQQLQEMAETWTMLANTRKEQLHKQRILGIVLTDE